MPTEPVASPLSTPATPQASPAAPSQPNWFDSLPPDLQGDKTIAGYKGKDVVELAKSLVGAQKLIGVDKIAKPQEGWGQAEWDAFYDATGRPKDASEYAVPENLPSGIKLDDDMTKAFFQKAREAGLTKRQAAAMVSHYAEMSGAASEHVAKQQSEQLAAATAELKRRLGPAYDERLGMARDALRFAASDADRESLLSNPMLANNPAFIELMANVGKAVATDQIIGRGSSFKAAMTPNDAQAELSKLNADKEHIAAIMDASHAGHKAALDRRTELYALIQHGS